MIIQHCQRSQKARKLVGKSTPVDDEIWTYVRQFIAERFAKGRPATTEGALEFISHAFPINLCHNMLRCKLRRDS
jgi:hypothetical protein